MSLKKLWLIMPTLLWSCTAQTVKPVNQFNELAVWADDGSEIALVKTANGQQQIITRTLDGEQQNAITALQARVYQKLYYMKSAGYLIVQSKTSSGWTRFERVDLNGNEITIIETPTPTASLCQNMPQTPHAYTAPDVIPSPDGHTLAYIFSPECAVFNVDFLSADNLVTLDSQIINSPQTVKATWHSNGDLLLAVDDGKTAWRLQAKQKPRVSDYPRCLQPVTLSSAIAADGRLLHHGNDNIEVENLSPSTAFGCQ
jgi:hypothetical protein